VDGLLPPEFEINLFRISQETLNNVLKHASATRVKVALTREHANLRLIVEDNGCGFDPSQPGSLTPDERGLGLREITERTRMMRGRVVIQSCSAQGTRVTVEVPLPNRKNHP
jgi:signal transduction histidine kinase